MNSEDFSLGFNINTSNLKNNNSISIHEVEDNTDTIEFKIILVGSSSVGKTSIYNRFILNEFSNSYKATITAETKSKYIKIDKYLFAKLNIWDTCGSEAFRAVTKQFYRGAHAAIVIFDLTEQNTFNDLKKWVKDIKNYGEKNIEILIVGNKLDLIEQRTVAKSQAINFCRENGEYKYIEASAKDGTNVLKIFEELTFDLAKKHQKEKDKEISNSYKIKTLFENNDNNGKDKKGCC